MSTKVNPFYLLAFVLVLLVVSYLNYSSAKEKLDGLTSEYATFYQNASLLKSLQSRWDSDAKRELMKVLKDRELVNAGAKVTYTKNRANISLATKNQKAVNRLLSKILNGHFEVVSFTLESQETATLNIEVAI